MDCLALKHQSEHYPAEWNGRVPKRVRMLKTVRPDLWRAMGYEPGYMCAVRGEEYEAGSNSHGAVSILIDGRLLGVKPGEFEVVEWHY